MVRRRSKPVRCRRDADPFGRRGLSRAIVRPRPDDVLGVRKVGPPPATVTIFWINGAALSTPTRRPSRCRALSGETAPRATSRRRRSRARRAFIPEVFRRDFPILDQEVNGRPLIWLDNAATTQKPQSVIDRIAHFYAHDNSNIHRAAHTLAARATDAFEQARQKVRRFIGAPSVERDRLRSRHDRGHQSRRAEPRASAMSARATRSCSRMLEHHANIVPWQMLCAEKGAVLRVIPVDDRGEIMLERVSEAARIRAPGSLRFTQASNALGTIPPVARDDADGAALRRPRAGRRRAGGMPHAGQCAGTRCRLLRLLRPQDVRTDGHRRGLRQVGRCSKSCRPGRAAAA